MRSIKIIAAVVVAVSLLFGLQLAAAYWYMEVPPIAESRLHQLPPSATRDEIERRFGAPDAVHDGGRELNYQRGHWKVVKIFLKEDGTLKNWYIDD